MNNLTNIGEIRHYQNILQNWQMVPLETRFDNIKSLAVKYEADEHFWLFENNPIIESTPFFIELDFGDASSFLCFYFLKIYEQNGKKYSIHETIFNLTDEVQRNDCLEVNKEDGGVVLMSNKNLTFIRHSLPPEIVMTRARMIDFLMQEAQNKYIADFMDAVNIIRGAKEDCRELYEWLKELSNEAGMSLLKLHLDQK